MSDRGTLLAYYIHEEDARQALRHLRRSRFRHVALISKDSAGDLQIERGAYLPRIVLGAAGASLLGVLLGVVGLFLLRNQSLAGAMLGPLAMAIPTLAGAAGTWLILRRANLREDADLLKRYASWLVPKETALLLRASSRKLGGLVPLLRSVSESQPSIFPLQPARHLAISTPELQKVLLPSAQIHQHALHLAEEHKLQPSAGRDQPLFRRLDRAEDVIESVRRDLADADRLEQGVSPSAEWILDNSHIIRAHINEVRRNLSRRFYRELPELSGIGLPRIYSLAAELVLHTDNRLDRFNIEDFLEAYQSVSALTIGELWALPLMLRIAMMQNLRVLAEGVDRRLHERELADFWGNRLLATARRDPSRLFAILAELSEEVSEPSAYFATQLTGHLYDEESALVPVQIWLERQFQSTVAEILVKEQAREASDRISMANAVTSLRDLSLLDWRELFESQNQVERILREDPAGVYAQMDFETRDRYRSAVEGIARRAARPEHVVADATIALAKDSDFPSRHIGTYLIGEGRPQLVAHVRSHESIGYRLRFWLYRHHTSVYLGSIALLTTGIIAGTMALALALDREMRPFILIGGLLSLIPTNQLGILFVNYAVSRLLPPRTLSKMSFEESGIPDSFRTLVVVPVILNTPETTREEIEKLEIRYLANNESNLLFSLFTDLADADRPHQEGDDQLLEAATQGIEALNRQYGGDRFMLFHRPRQWCDSEGCYMGWERKRGKLEQLNGLIAGESPSGDLQIVQVGDPNRLLDIRFVITLDSDTQLPSGSARRMIETLAHPLNHSGDRLPESGATGGYTIIQPRVSTALPSATSTPFTRVFTDPVGSDPYTKAVSDVYQDLAGEGSYHGKGIYDPRAFSSTLRGRFPEQRLLSHDLIEGAHVRVGLASDIELYDEFPPDYLTYVRRQHRWIRGDWQIADWILPRVPVHDGSRGRNSLNLLNRWKIFDNLRRSLVPVACVAYLVASWLISPALGGISSGLIGLLNLFHPLVQPVTWATSAHAGAKFSWREIFHAIVRSLLEGALLPHQAGLAIDAILRTWYRRLISRRKLLEWTTAQMAAWSAAKQVRSFLFNLGLISVLSLLAGFAVWKITPGSLWFAAPFLLLWIVSPLVAMRLNQKPTPKSEQAHLSADDIQRLRKLARKTWRYFDDFVGEETAWLPPDNYQVSHQDQLAMRTSPTNIGLWTLSALGAADFGYMTVADVIERLSHTFETMSGLERYEGHLLNWYDLNTLQPLEPRYVSSVDSGNLLAALWTLENGMQELLDAPIIGPQAIQGLSDMLGILQEQIQSKEAESVDGDILAVLDELFSDPPGGWEEVVDRLRRADKPARTLAARLREEAGLEAGAAYWARQIERQISAWLSLVDRFPVFPGKDEFSIAPSLRNLASQDGEENSGGHKVAAELLEKAQGMLSLARELANGVNMRFLYDRQRRLFSIGYNVSAGSLDGSFYDLLASEARLGSYVAIARGDVPYEHWLAMGRPFGSVNGRRALLSWSGTMFEYLMPNLLQRRFSNSLLETATKTAVVAQQDYARSRGVPWGMSESAFGDLDLNKTYQYRAFGVPGLGMKRGLDEDLVVAPYATMLALAVDPSAAIDNLNRLDDFELNDGYGFFEAIDFSRQRRREGDRGVLVRAYMAHHQGMSFLALDNLIHDGIMRLRFHADPRVKAAEPLLYERVPVAPPLHHVSSREALPSRVSETGIAPSVSKFDTPHSPTPRVQLSSNRSYSLAVTSAGGGYSRWKDFDLTRWRADTARDHWGVFCYIRDLESGEFWSNTHHPAGRFAEEFGVNFAVDRAEFKRLDEGIETETEVVVSPEDDAEIRRVTLTNRTGRRRELEITSYAELAMAQHAADRQHPVFQKMFIQTKSIPMQGTLYAHRRPRNPDEDPIFAAHRLTFEGDYSWAMQFETDRRQFIGRGRSAANPVALERELSNSEGFVLDPIFSLRRAMTLEPNGRVQFSLVLAAGASRASVLAISEKYSDPSAVDRALELAWVNTQLELRSLRFHPDDARRFQKLASHMLYPSSPLRPPGERLAQNQLGQDRLWPYGLSGDLPIAAVTIGEARDIGLVRQLLQAHTYWRVRGLTADLLILNEESSSYEGVLNEQLKRLVQAHSMFTGIDIPGGVFLRSVDQLPEEDLTLMLTVADVSMVAARGPLAQQLGGLGEPVDLPDKLRFNKIKEEPSAALPHVQLTHENGLGGFTPDGREYVITLGAEDQTPAPWVNVMANPEFGALISESGSGFAWYGNSQRNRLIGWSNDPVSDTPSDAIYIRDLDRGIYWTPTPLPVREREPYRIRHGAGYSIFEHNSHAIEQQLTVFVPMDDDGGEPIRLQRLRLKNDLSRACRLSITFYLEWALGENRETTQKHVMTQWDEANRVLMARNRYHPDYSERIAFAALGPSSKHHTGDRIEFLGRNGSLERPIAMEREGLSGRTGAGLDPCGALQVELELEPGEEREVTCMLGQVGSLEEMQGLIRKYREPLAVESSLRATVDWWDKVLGKIQVDLPDQAASHMLNRWLLYQDLLAALSGSQLSDLGSIRLVSIWRRVRISRSTAGHDGAGLR
jgi:cyclic beta-1,2-glucan synthetase